LIDATHSTSVLLGFK